MATIHIVKDFMISYKYTQIMSDYQLSDQVETHERRPLNLQQREFQNKSSQKNATSFIIPICTFMKPLVLYVLLPIFYQDSLS